MTFHTCSSCVSPHARPTRNRSPANFPVHCHKRRIEQRSLLRSWAQSLTTSATNAAKRHATMTKYYDCVSQHAVDLFLEPLRSAHQCVMIRTDTDTEGLKTTVLCMYIIHCRVIVDNRSEFCHFSSHVDCTFNAGLVRLIAEETS